jgi:type I restriction enzyme, S subunit
VNEQLPEGWAEANLGQLGEYLNGRAFKSSEWRTTGRPIVRIEDLTGSKTKPNYYDGAVEERYVVRPGDLLISWAATLGAYVWSGSEGVLNQHIFKVRSFVDKRFHYYLVRHLLDVLYEDTHGSGMVHITKDKCEGAPVLLPPLAEQKRIVAKNEELLAHVDARERLGRVPRILKRFRQAVLAAACSGRLANSDAAGWPNVALGDVCREVTVGHVGPMLGEYVDEGIPFLRSQNVRDFRIDPANLRFVSREFHTRLKKSALSPGDVVWG